MSAPSSSSPKEITGHDDYPKHNLIKVGEEAMLHVCEYCGDKLFVGLGSCYECTDCNGESIKYFHRACLIADSTKPYPFIPNFELKFSLGKKGKNCTACWKSVRKIMYTGCPDNEDNYLHPQCIDLPPKLQRDGFELKLCCKTSVKCRVCQINECWCYGYISNGNLQYACKTSMECFICGSGHDMGWCYGNIKSNEKFEYAFHVYCLKSRLVNYWLSENIRVVLPDRKKYFEGLYREDLQRIKSAVRGILEAAAGVLLDLILSTFMGAPLATFISASVGVAKELRN